MSTVLVISESEAIRTALDVMLSLGGYRAVMASAPEEALRAVAVESVHLVIVETEYADDAAPGEAVVALLRAVRTSRPRLPFLVLAAADDVAGARLLSFDAVARVLKPWENERLLNVVRRLIDEQNAASGSEPSDLEIEQALLRAHGVLSRAARQLGISSQALYARIQGRRRI